MASNELKYAEELQDDERKYTPVVVREAGIKGAVVPRAKPGRGGGSTGFNSGQLMPYNVITPENPSGYTVDPNTIKPDEIADKVEELVIETEEVIEEIRESPFPETSGSSQGAKALLNKFNTKGSTPKIIKTKNHKMETNMTSTPDVPIKFSGSFGEIEAYYFDVSIQNDMIVLLWDKNYRGSKYTPPRTNREDEPSEPITVTFEGKTYKAHNFNLKFEIKSANLEILVLIIHKEDVLE